MEGHLSEREREREGGQGGKDGCKGKDLKVKCNLSYANAA